MCKMGTRMLSILVATVTHTLLELFIFQELIQYSLLTSFAPVMFQWKDAQSKRHVQLKQ
jgi:hypothetical protein